MNKSYEKDTSLKWLFYRAFRAWRPIVLFTVLVALFVGIISATFKLVKLNDEEFMNNARLDFERDHAAWVISGENLTTQLDNLEISRARQLEYNDNSILMKIDPRKKSVASLTLYINYEVPNDANLNYKPADLISPLILNVYETYIFSGEMHQYILKNLSEEMELRYLQEILVYDKANLSLRVTHINTEKCHEVFDLAKQGLLSQQPLIDDIIQQKNIDKDLLTVKINETTPHEELDFELEKTQNENIKLIADLDLQIQETYSELRTWKNSSEPQFDYTTREVIKDVILATVISGIVSFFIIFAIVTLIAIRSGKLRNPEDVKSVFQLQLFGVLPMERVKKPLLPAKLTRLFGIHITPEEYVSQARLIAASIGSVANAQDVHKSWKRIAFTGMISDEEMQKAIDAMQIKEYEIICATNTLTNSTSMEAIADADAVVLVEAQEKTILQDIEKELELLRAWNKNILGAVVINVDAIM